MSTVRKWPHRPKGHMSTVGKWPHLPKGNMSTVRKWPHGPKGHMSTVRKWPHQPKGHMSTVSYSLDGSRQGMLHSAPRSIAGGRRLHRGRSTWRETRRCSQGGPAREAPPPEAPPAPAGGGGLDTRWWRAGCWSPEPLTLAGGGGGSAALATYTPRHTNPHNPSFQHSAYTLTLQPAHSTDKDSPTPRLHPT